MNTLDYESPTAARPWTWVAVLFLLPLAATALLFYIAMTNGQDEPYGFFNWSDALMQVGGSAVVVLLWLAWAGVWIAFSRRTKWRWLAGLPVFLWGVVTVRAAVWFATGYFGEPWNYSYP